MMTITIQTAQTTITTEQFLTELHGPDADIYFHIGNKTWKKSRKYDDKLKTTLHWLNTKKNKDICFIVNSGGTKNSQITQINAVFIDWDCGKNSGGNYFPLDIVSERKALFLPKIKNFSLTPSFTVETRNGYQVYWLLYPGTTTNQFIDIQKKLADRFESDKSVYNPARVMRLPGYYWIKPGSNCDPFFVSAIEYNPIRYCVDIFSNSLLSASLVSQDNCLDYIPSFSRRKSTCLA